MTITYARTEPQLSSTTRLRVSQNVYTRAATRKRRGLDAADRRIGFCEHCGGRSFTPWCNACTSLPVTALCRCTGIGDHSCQWVRMLVVVAAGNRFDRSKQQVAS